MPPSFNGEALTNPVKEISWCGCLQDAKLVVHRKKALRKRDCSLFVMSKMT
jgi:hypothetical protein